MSKKVVDSLLVVASNMIKKLLGIKHLRYRYKLLRLKYEITPEREYDLTPIEKVKNISEQHKKEIRKVIALLWILGIKFNSGNIVFVKGTDSQDYVTCVNEKTLEFNNCNLSQKLYSKYFVNWQDFKDQVENIYTDEILVLIDKFVKETRDDSLFYWSTNIKSRYNSFFTLSLKKTLNK